MVLVNKSVYFVFFVQKGCGGGCGGGCGVGGSVYRGVGLGLVGDEDFIVTERLTVIYVYPQMSYLVILEASGSDGGGGGVYR